MQLSGSAGDMLVFDVDLVHAGGLNLAGGRRRSILIGCLSESIYASNRETVNLRGVRMDTADRFDPSEFVLGG